MMNSSTFNFLTSDHILKNYIVVASVYCALNCKGCVHSNYPA